MEWRDEGIVIGVRRHGEASVVLELMTHAHGRHLGLVRGGRSSRLQPILQAGNSVEVVWRARLDEHLGNYAVEGTNLRAAKLLDSPVALYGLSVLGAFPAFCRSAIRIPACTRPSGSSSTRCTTLSSPRRSSSGSNSPFSLS